MIFTADNGDATFPMTVPIIPETHEGICLFDIDRQTCRDGSSDLDMCYQAQATQAIAERYFGAYTPSMRDISALQRHETLQQ